MIKMGAAYWTARASGLDKEESIFVCGLWTGKASIQVTKTPLFLSNHSTLIISPSPPPPPLYRRHYVLQH